MTLTTGMGDIDTIRCARYNALDSDRGERDEEAFLKGGRNADHSHPLESVVVCLSGLLLKEMWS